MAQHTKPQCIPRIQVKVGDKVILALLDTGADISAIRADVWQMLPSSQQGQLQPNVTPARSVTGAPLQVIGCQEVTFVIGDTAITHTFRIVTDIDSPLILGWDLIHLNGLVIQPDFTGLKVGTEIVPFLHRGNLPPDVSKVRLLQTTVLPGRTEVLVQGYLTHEEGQPTMQFDGVLEPAADPAVAFSRVVATA